MKLTCLRVTFKILILKKKMYYRYIYFDEFVAAHSEATLRARLKHSLIPLDHLEQC